MTITSVTNISRIDLVSRDPDRLACFYGEAFGFVSESAPTKALESRRFVLTLGAQKVALLRPMRAGAPYPTEVPGSSCAFQHFAIVVSDMPTAFAHLKTVPGWSAISAQGPQILPASAGGVTAFKFRDPEGHPLELLAFPPSATPSAWRGAGRGLFLGVDHTAISVRDTQRSLAFYEGLGFARTGGSLNQGPAQERLDAISGVKVEVTSLALAAEPPHLELLSYQGAEAVGAEAPDRDDIAASRTVMSAEGANGLERDPDGHWLEMEEASK